MADKNTQPGLFKRAVADAERLAGGEMITGDGYALYRYPDYETYKAVQTAGNKAKIKRQFVRESHIATLADAVSKQLGPVRFGLCHGTRRGAEQAWFTSHLPGNPEVIGTEISDTATSFPNTVQWDFHDDNPDWRDRADFVYSNSWDHAFDPPRAFRAWINSLRPGGLLLLDHTKDQTPETSNALDAFGITFEGLEQMLRDQFSDLGELLPVIDTRRTNPEYRARVVVFARKG